MFQPTDDERAARELYRHYVERLAEDRPTAQRRMRRAQARHVAHSGGATVAERRDMWDAFYPEGPSRRSLLPDRFALLYAMLEDSGLNAPAAWQDGRPELAHWDALGLTGARREDLCGDFYPYFWETAEPLAAGRLFDRERVGRWIGGMLPGMLARVNSQEDLQCLVRVLRGLPDWVWQAWEGQPELARLRCRQASAPEATPTPDGAAAAAAGAAAPLAAEAVPPLPSADIDAPPPASRARSERQTA